MKRKNHLFFIAPGFIIYSLFITIPVIYVLYLSLFQWSGVGDKVFVGMDNFVQIFTNPRFSPMFFSALKNNIKYLLCVWFIITPFQYFIAYILYLKIPAFKYIKFMIFMPYVISSTIVSFFAVVVFDPNIGVLNQFLELIGKPELQSAWFGDPKLAFPLMILLIMWQGAGVGVMIFYSNFISISGDILEAGKIDGCSEIQRFFHILLPLSLPSCASIITMSTIWALAIFDMPFILGGATGGVSGSLDFVNLVFYRTTFGSILDGKANLGFGSAISSVMFIIIFVISFTQNKILSKFEYET